MNVVTPVKRTEWLQVRLTPAEKAELQRRATAANQRPSEFVRRQLCGEPTEAPDPATRIAAKVSVASEAVSPDPPKPNPEALLPAKIAYYTNQYSGDRKRAETQARRDLGLPPVP